MANIIIYNDRLIEMSNTPIIASGLYAYYSANNTVNDSLGNYNGTANNINYTTGINNNAWSLSGASSSYVSLPNDYFEPSGAFTVNYWFNTSSTATQTIQTNVESNGYLGFRLFVGGVTKVAEFRIFPLGVSFYALASGANAYNLGSWNMITAVNDPSNGMFIYCNGVLVASNTTKQSISWGSTTINRIGLNYDNATPFNGALDECGSWTRALSQTEITYLYNNGVGRFFPTF